MPGGFIQLAPDSVGKKLRTIVDNNEHSLITVVREQKSFCLCYDQVQKYLNGKFGVICNHTSTRKVVVHDIKVLTHETTDVTELILSYEIYRANNASVVSDSLVYITPMMVVEELTSGIVTRLDGGGQTLPLTTFMGRVVEQFEEPSLGALTLDNMYHRNPFTAYGNTPFKKGITLRQNQALFLLCESDPPFYPYVTIQYIITDEEL